MVTRSQRVAASTCRGSCALICRALAALAQATIWRRCSSLNSDSGLRMSPGDMHSVAALIALICIPATLLVMPVALLLSLLREHAASARNAAVPVNTILAFIPAFSLARLDHRRAGAP